MALKIGIRKNKNMMLRTFFHGFLYRRVVRSVGGVPSIILTFEMTKQLYSYNTDRNTRLFCFKNIGALI